MKCLIVDDEYSIRQALLLMGRYSDFGFSTLLEAENGSQALSIIMSEKPDLIVVDMKMGIYDGVWLFKEIEKLNDKPAIIVVSGYSDFKFMHSALSVRAIDYVLKPVGYDRYNESLEKASRSINCQSGQKTKANRIEPKNNLTWINGADSRDLESFPIVRDFLRDSESYHVFLLFIFDFDTVCASHYGSMTDVFITTIQTEIEDNLSKSNQVLVLRIIGEDNIFIGLIKPGKVDSNADLIIDLNTLQENIKKILNVDCAIGLSESVTLMKDCNAAFNDARYALVNGDLLKENLIFAQGTRANKAIQAQTMDESRFDAACRTGKIGDIMQIVTTQIEVAAKKGAYCLHYLEQLFFQMQNCAFNLYFAQNIPLPSSYELLMRRTIRKMSQSARNTQVVAECLNNFIQPLTKDISVQNINELMNGICEFINRNYSKKISLTMLSKEFFVSKEHISRLFSKELNKTFVSYLTEVRLNHICKMLVQQPKLSIAQIAYKSGFSDAGYMTRTFKRVYGMTPNEYRKGNQKQAD